MKESDILDFLNQIKTIFGDQLNQECIFSEEKMKIKVLELKNKFGNQSNYQDLKIIFDVAMEGDLTFSLEMQCHL